MKRTSIPCGLIVLATASIVNSAGPEEAVVKVDSTRRFPNVICETSCKCSGTLDEKSVAFRFAEDHVETLVFPRKELEVATAKVMAENGIPRRGTPDPTAVWHQKTLPLDPIRGPRRRRMCPDLVRPPESHDAPARFKIHAPRRRLADRSVADKPRNFGRAARSQGTGRSLTRRRLGSRVRRTDPKGLPNDREGMDWAGIVARLGLALFFTVGFAAGFGLYFDKAITSPYLFEACGCFFVWVLALLSCVVCRDAC